MSTLTSLSSADLETHAAWIRALARRLVRDESAADDLVQETWLRALRARPSTKGSLRPWLARVVRNLAASRRRSPAAAVELERERASELDLAPDRAAETLEQQRLLVELVQGLPESQRTTLVQRYVHGLSAPEIARAQGLAAGTVRWRLKQSIDRLRDELDQRNGGERARWTAALLPLFRREELATAGATASAGVPFVLALFAAVAVFVASVAVRYATRSGPASSVEPAVLAAGDDAASVGRTSADEIAANLVEAVEPSTTREPLAATAGGPSRFAIRVTDSETGEPVQGVRIRAVPDVYRGTLFLDFAESSDAEIDQRPLTDLEGRARMSVRPGVAHHLEVEGRRFATGEQYLTFEALEPGTTRSLALEVTPPGEVLHGVVLDRGSNITLSGGRVVVRSQGADESCLGNEVVVSADGTFEVRVMPGDMFGIEVEQPGYAPAYVLSELDNHSAEDPLEVPMTPGQTLDVSVVDVQGRPLPGVEVRVATASRFLHVQHMTNVNVYPSTELVWSAITDARGACQVADLRPRDVVTFAVLSGDETLLETQERTLEDASRAELTLVVGGGCRVEGRVLDALGHPQAEVELWLVWDEWSIVDDRENLPHHYLEPDMQRYAHARTRTDENGRYAIGELEPGFWWLGPAPGQGPSGTWAARAAMIAVEADAESMQQDLVVREGAPLRGTVVDSSGRPPPAVTVSIDDNNAAKVDEDGRFDFGLVTAGEYPVEVFSETTGTTLGQFTIRAGEEWARLVVRPGASISGRLTRGDSGLDEPALLYLTRVDSPTPLRTRSQWTKQDGTFEIEGLDPGSYHVAGHLDSDWSGVSGVVDVTSGDEAAGVLVELRPAGLVRVLIDEPASVQLELDGIVRNFEWGQDYEELWMVAPPGTCTLRVGDLEQSVQVTAGETIRVTLHRD